MLAEDLQGQEVALVERGETHHQYMLIFKARSDINMNNRRRLQVEASRDVAGVETPGDTKYDKNDDDDPDGEDESTEGGTAGADPGKDSDDRGRMTGISWNKRTNKSAKIMDPLLCEKRKKYLH